MRGQIASPTEESLISLIGLRANRVGHTQAVVAYYCA